MGDTFDENPGEGICLNVDGSASARGCSGGGVIRDHLGKPLLLFSVDFGRGLLNTEADFRAALHGLQLARSQNISVDLLMTDSKVLSEVVAGRDELMKEL